MPTLSELSNAYERAEMAARIFVEDFYTNRPPDTKHPREWSPFSIADGRVRTEVGNLLGALNALGSLLGKDAL